ncbi:MAG: hypothetical protein M1292_04515 [Bacteroidetes bacterium]|nr:hypothetical protein [Bacteroidota bacterium]
MADINEKCYGSFGWRQFWENRIDILKEYDRLKGLNLNSPVRTSHGVALEAKIRDWLTTFLPKKYAVTSGYIIPDLVVDTYTLKHFDIIIYDQLQSPILWVEDTLDNSPIGAKKAIPAKYVYSVIEVKATLNKKHIADSISKLKEISELKEFLPSTFSCSSIFAEIGNDVPNNTSVLEGFIDCVDLVNYAGSLILRSDADETSSGQIVFSTIDKEVNLNPAVSLTKPIDNLDIYVNQTGQLKIAESCGGAALCATSSNTWSVTKLYSPYITKKGIYISLEWSHNSFTRFFIQLMSSLDGIKLKKEQLNFGQVYDRINRKDD